MSRDLPSPPEFDAAFRARLHELFCWRRDVRRFRQDALPEGMLERLIEIACTAPSVGLSQPWRFVVVEDRARRQTVLANFEAANAEALGAYGGERAQHYATLKLAGLREAPCHLAVFADRGTPLGHALGRRTMPETAEYSAVAAIFSLWLAARAEGLGVGWVSILDPAAIAAALDVPAHWRFIGYFCIGYPETEDDCPELERAGWEQRRPAAESILRR
ncbi:5,6-dimethylbenzimidazole synthase [Bradyrhizobium sp.]|uniref:5,6-dimethylbenzimidazole synthase n=1 Tax=Bradyrhizobium sp. TaxID=376 RepID=UPI0025BCAE52|nr:5,6-dimethylbenzimidazole synthase [Bradyrhizobium sp.]MBV8921388.1 5,6-dimethylbenzimidazole synthase [Bradyrhizobium sp.]